MPRRAPFFPLILSGDGATKEFALDFPVLDPSHLKVIVGGALKVLGTDYFFETNAPVTPALYASHIPGADTSKVKIRFAAAPANSANNIKVYRNTPIARPSTPSNPMQGPEVSLYSHFRNQEWDDAIVQVGGDSGGAFGQTALLAGTALSFVAPEDGYITNLDSIVLTAITTGGTLAVAVDGVAVTGITQTIANSAAVGASQRTAPSVAQASYTKVQRGQTITVTPASFATAGNVKVTVEIQPADLT